jgi:hypothetical protein
VSWGGVPGWLPTASLLLLCVLCSIHCSKGSMRDVEAEEEREKKKKRKQKKRKKEKIWKKIQS